MILDLGSENKCLLYVCATFQAKNIHNRLFLLGL